MSISFERQHNFEKLMLFWRNLDKSTQSDVQVIPVDKSVKKGAAIKNPMSTSFERQHNFENLTLFWRNLDKSTQSDVQVISVEKNENNKTIKQPLGELKCDISSVNDVQYSVEKEPETLMEIEDDSQVESIDKKQKHSQEQEEKNKKAIPEISSDEKNTLVLRSASVKTLREKYIEKKKLYEKLSKPPSPKRKRSNKGPGFMYAPGETPKFLEDHGPDLKGAVDQLFTKTHILDIKFENTPIILKKDETHDEKQKTIYEISLEDESLKVLREEILKNSKFVKNKKIEKGGDRDCRGGRG